jgi:Zn-dependent protease
MLAYTFWMNIVLGGFNLLPGFPMDGGRIFRSVARIFTTRAKATYIAMIVGRIFAVLLALRGLHSLVTGGGWGFISLLIAWMIWREGWREYQQALIDEQWGGPWDWSARVSPPPYGGDEDDVEVRRRR